MGFLIRWKDNNVAEEGHHIYRSQTSMAGLDASQLPAPYDTVGPDITEYEDGAVTPGETYYYRVGAFTASGTVVLLSPEREAVAEEPSWNAAGYFAQGEGGGALDIQDVSTLFQDVAATIPVTAPGQTVGCVLDVSGNANHATQSDPAARPVYGTDGVHHWLDMSSGKWLLIGSHAVQDHAMAMVYDTQDEAAALFWARDYNTQDWRYVFQDGSTSTTMPPSDSILLSLHVDGVEKSTGLNRDGLHSVMTGKHLSVFQSTSPAEQNNAINFGRYGDASHPPTYDLDGRLYLLLWRTTLFDDTERGELESSIMQATGVAPA